MLAVHSSHVTSYILPFRMSTLPVRQRAGVETENWMFAACHFLVGFLKGQGMNDTINLALFFFFTIEFAIELASVGILSFDFKHSDKLLTWWVWPNTLLLQDKLV